MTLSGIVSQPLLQAQPSSKGHLRAQLPLGVSFCVWGLFLYHAFPTTGWVLRKPFSRSRKSADTGLSKLMKCWRTQKSIYSMFCLRLLT